MYRLIGMSGSFISAKIVFFPLSSQLVYLAFTFEEVNVSPKYGSHGWRCTLGFPPLLCRFFILQVLQFVSQRITLWKSAPFHVGWRSNPYPPHYTEAFAFSTILYPHLVRLLLRLAYLYHVKNRRDTGLPSSVQATDDRLRVYLSTGSAASV